MSNASPSRSRCSSLDRAARGDAVMLRTRSLIALIRCLPRGAGKAAAGTQMTMGAARHAGRALARPRGDGSVQHAVHGHVRAARRDGEAAAGQPAGAQPGRVVDRLGRRARVRVRPAQGNAIPQRRSRHRRRTSSSRSSATGAPRSKTFKERVAAVEIPGPTRVRFRLKEPWPDFLTFYSSATGAGWIVPKKYVEKVGDDGFKKRADRRRPLPVRLVHAGRGARAGGRRPVLAQDPAGEAAGLQDDSGSVHAVRRAQARARSTSSYWMTASLGEELRRTPGLTLKPALANNAYWVYFVDQWDPKSPWHDRRVRLAANYAIDRQAINQAETLGFSRMTYSMIPSHFEFFWQPPVIPLRSGPGQAAPRRGRLPQRLRRGRLHLRRRARPASPSRWPTICRPPASA